MFRPPPPPRCCPKKSLPSIKLAPIAVCAGTCELKQQIVGSTRERIVEHVCFYLSKPNSALEETAAAIDVDNAIDNRNRGERLQPGLS